MKWRVFIVMVVLLGAAGAVFSDDYIDDVYYWETSEPVVREVVVSEPVSNEPTVQITFIEDSITQKSDTIVKAIIHR